MTEYSSKSSYEHKGIVEKAVELLIRRYAEERSIETSTDAGITMGCFALGLAPVLYSNNAQRVLEEYDN